LYGHNDGGVRFGVIGYSLGCHAPAHQAGEGWEAARVPRLIDLGRAHRGLTPSGGIEEAVNPLLLGVEVASYL